MEALVPLLVVVPLAAAFVVVAMANLPHLARRRTESNDAALTNRPGGGHRVLSLLACAAVLANFVIALALLRTDVGKIYVGGWGPGGALGIELVCDGLAKLMVVT
ncbi:MAG: hypothetical protein KAU28_04610, partial [Phycisphaerae bacterium]|nr:hypothetical protein [Phycisphaerae bacterium]